MGVLWIELQPFFYYEALGGYNYMQFLGKTIWVRKLPMEVAFFIWIATLRFFFFLITCVRGHPSGLACVSVVVRWLITC